MSTETETSATVAAVESVINPPIPSSSSIVPTEIVANSRNAIGIKLNTGNGQSKDDIERQILVAALYANGGNKTKAAVQMGICRRTIHRLLAKHHITEKYIQKPDGKRHCIFPRKPPSIYHQDNDYFKTIEKEGAKAIQVLDLENEVALLRAQTLELLKKFRDGTATVGHDKLGNPTTATDIDQSQAIVSLTKTIALVRKADYDMIRDTVITLANFKIWMAKLAAEIKAEFPDIESQKKFCLAASRAGDPVRGDTEEET